MDDLQALFGNLAGLLGAVALFMVAYVVSRDYVPTRTKYFRVVFVLVAVVIALRLVQTFTL